MSARVDAAEVIAAALRAVPIGPSLDEAAERIAAALDEAGYVIRRKPAPRKAAAPVEVYAPATGNPAIDEFMRRKHSPHYRPLPMPRVLGVSAPNGGKKVSYNPDGVNRVRGGDNRRLNIVLDEAIKHAAQFGWPGSYNIYGTPVPAGEDSL